MRDLPLRPRRRLGGAWASEGLSAFYYANESLSGTPERVAVDPIIAFDWGTGGPAELPDNHFSGRWLGGVTATATEDLTLIARSDDGIRLWLDGELVIDAWEPRAVADSAFTFAAVAGRRYDLRLEYYERGGLASLALEWQSATHLRQPIPASALATVADLTVNVPLTSAVSPAFIEGRHRPDAPIALAVNGATRPVESLGDIGFYADIDLGPILPRLVRINSGATTRWDLVFWSPTTISGSSAMSIRVHDALLLRSPANGTLTIRRECGGWIGPIAVRPGAIRQQAFDEPGNYQIVVANRNGAVVGELDLTVVGFVPPAPTACEVGFTRTIALGILPAAGAAELSGEDDGVIRVVPIAPGDRAAVTPQRQPSPRVLVRLPGSGPVIGSYAVDAFTIVSDFELEDGFEFHIDDEGFGHGEFGFRMTPRIPYVDITVEFFVPTMSVEGRTTFTIPGIEMDADGHWSAPYVMVPGQSKTCHKLIVAQP